MEGLPRKWRRWSPELAKDFLEIKTGVLRKLLISDEIKIDNYFIIKYF
jgi:hypothetical protein